MTRGKITLFTAIFMAMAFTISCGQHDPFGNSFADGSGSGEDDPSSSLDEGDGSLLGSCVGMDHGNRACVEIYYANDWNASLAQQACVNGIWSAGSACPEWWIDVGYSIDGSGIIYYYPDPVQLPDDAVLLAAGELTEGSIAELDGEAWYKFMAAAGASYRFSWDDFLSDGASGDMADVVVDLYNGDGDLIFHGDDMEDEPPVIALESGGLVYVRVTRISEGGGAGFSIVYGEGSL